MSAKPDKEETTMAQRTVARMYDSYDDARTVVSELEAAGIPHGDIRAFSG
jgi:hypothetical protein